MNDIPNTSQLLRHCSVLFGDHLEFSDDFLDYVQLSGVRCAYRRRVKETHPDLAASRGEVAGSADLTDFLSVRQSYEILSSFIAARITRQSMDSAVVPPSFRYANDREQGPWQPATGFSIPEPTGLPRRPLKLGDFLYHLGLVSWKDVIAALVWQKASRPRFGELACRFGWLRKDDIGTIFRARNPGQLFGDTAVDLGILAVRQRDSLLFHQKIRQPKLGRFFIDNGAVDEAEMLKYVTLLRRHNSLHAPLV
jgi:hypothetical protein